MNGGDFAHDNTVAPPAGRVLPMFSLKGKTAIVSGAGAGIGLSVAHALAEAGANVAIWYNSNKKAIAEAEKIEKEYGVKCESDSLPSSVVVCVCQMRSWLRGRLLRERGYATHLTSTFHQPRTTPHHAIPAKHPTTPTIPNIPTNSLTSPQAEPTK